MKAEDIVRQLYGALPLQTDLFSNAINISSLSRVGSTVTAVTPTAHNLSTGAGITITGAKTPVSISSLTFADGIATAITSSRQDLTEGWENGVPSDTALIEILGTTEPEYNGSNLLLTVENRTKFTYSVTGTPTTPATGTPILLEQPIEGYNGRHVVTVIDPTTFTYEITQTPDSPARGVPIAHTQIRVSGSISIERTIEAYTAKNTDVLWAFVILGDTSVSKDRHIASDATATKSVGSDLRQRLISPFSVFVIVPTTAQLSARAARDMMEDVRIFMLSSLLNSQFDGNLLTKSYPSTYLGDGFFQYSKAFYVHQFLFEAISDIITNDGIPPDANVAFRDIPLEFLDKFDTTELSVTVNLDDNP